MRLLCSRWEVITLQIKQRCCRLPRMDPWKFYNRMRLHEIHAIELVRGCVLAYASLSCAHCCCGTQASVRIGSQERFEAARATLPEKDSRNIGLIVAAMVSFGPQLFIRCSLGIVMAVLHAGS